MLVIVKIAQGVIALLIARRSDVQATSVDKLHARGNTVQLHPLLMGMAHPEHGIAGQSSAVMLRSCLPLRPVKGDDEIAISVLRRRIDKFEKLLLLEVWDHEGWLFAPYHQGAKSLCVLHSAVLISSCQPLKYRLCPAAIVWPLRSWPSLPQLIKQSLPMRLRACWRFF
jgi:hypothetical protein